MEDLEKTFVNTAFLDCWHQHGHKLQAFLQQPEAAAVLPGHKDQELDKWVSIQKKTRLKLPQQLQHKLSRLPHNFDQKADPWEQHYLQLSEFVCKNGHTHLPDEAKYETLKDWVLRQIQGKKYLSESRFQKLDKLGLCWDMVFTREQQWERMYARLKAYKATYGNCQVPQSWAGDKPLANWVCVQRRLQAKGKLQAYRREKLDELSFVWHVQPLYDARWQQYYQQLQQFYRKHGHCRVPGRYKQLTTWMENQRSACKSKRLLPERRQQLDAIAFIWSFDQVKEKTWEERYRQLQAFRKAHGHCLVAVGQKENKQLGNWVATQRKLQAGNKLPAAQKKKLDELGFVWIGQARQQLQSVYDSQWEERLEQLRAYRQTHGTCQVSLKTDPVLQRWIKWQRRLYALGRLSEQRFARLHELDFPWDIQESYWEKMYRALDNFKKEYGHTRVPVGWAPNRQLADWVYRMKTGRPQLETAKVALLDALGFDWRHQRKTVVSWEQMLARLLAFQQEHGHTRVPVKWPQDPKLGKWVSRMRQQKEKLPPDRRARLEKLAFDWQSPVRRKALAEAEK